MDTVSTGSSMLAWMIIGVGMACYFIPVLVAAARKSANVGMIFLVTLLVGWTVIGWFVCLIWAAVGQTKAQQMFYEKAAAA